MRRAAAGGLALVAACAAPSTTENCHKAVEQVHAWEGARVHGLTENDDVREAVGRLQEALRCADAADRPALEVQARLLAMRLLSKGAHAEALFLARALGEHPVAQWLRVEVSVSSGSMEASLGRYAEALVAAAARGEVEPARARLAAATYAPGNTALPTPESVEVVVTAVSAVESCVVVAPGTGLQGGMWLLGVSRDGRELPLHGDSPAVQWRKPRMDPVRLCAAGPLLDGDLAWGRVEGARAFEVPLRVTDGARARGRALDILSGRPVEPCLNEPRDPDARVACALGRGAP